MPDLVQVPARAGVDADLVQVRARGGVGIPRVLTRVTVATVRVLTRIAARILFVVVLGFLLFRLLPGDPALALSRGRAATAEEIAARRRDLGLDASVPEQLRRYVGDLLRGDLGTSFLYHRPVVELIGERLGPTVLLVGIAAVVTFLVGVATGVRAGWRPGTRFDRWTSAAALVLWSTPTFWLGFLLLIVFAAGVGDLPAPFPTGGMRTVPPPEGTLPGLLDLARHLALPCVTLVAVQVAQYHLLMRSGVAAQRDRPHLLLARATGLREAAVRRRHAVPGALVPTVSLGFVNLGFVVSGAVTVETVFSWPGLGYLAFEATRLPDLPLLNGTFLLFAGSVVVAGVLADAVLSRLDPRAAEVDAR